MHTLDLSHKTINRCRHSIKVMFTRRGGNKWRGVNTITEICSL